MSYQTHLEIETRPVDYLVIVSKVLTHLLTLLHATSGTKAGKICMLTNLDSGL